MVRLEPSEWRYAFVVALAPPGSVSKPQGMCVSQTPWPHRVDEFIVDVLLGTVDDTLNVTLKVSDERSEPDCVVLGQFVVTIADCCMQIFHEELDNASLVKIRDRHL
jgi:hypothetical protein